MQVISSIANDPRGLEVDGVFIYLYCYHHKLIAQMHYDLDLMLGPPIKRFVQRVPWANPQPAQPMYPIQARNVMALTKCGKDVAALPNPKDVSSQGSGNETQRRRRLLHTHTPPKVIGPDPSHSSRCGTPLSRIPPGSVDTVCRYQASAKQQMLRCLERELKPVVPPQVSTLRARNSGQCYHGGRRGIQSGRYGVHP